MKEYCNKCVECNDEYYHRNNADKGIEMEDKGELPGKTRLSLDENKAVFILPNEHLYQCPSCKDIVIK